MTTYGATYGTFLYGAELYGSTSMLAANYNWIIEVDWDGDGVFDGSNESGRLTEIQCNRGRKNFIQPNGQGFYPVSAGVIHLTMDNHDGRYDAWNTSSPLYPNVTYGRDVRVRVVDVATNTTYSVFYGIISDIVPSGYGANAIVKITAEDGLRVLINTAALAEYSTSHTVNTAISEIITNSGWAYGASISTSSTTLSRFWGGGGNAKDACSKLAEISMGLFFVSADNNATYIDPSASVSTATITSAEILKDIGNPAPWVNYRNAVSVVYKAVDKIETEGFLFYFGYIEIAAGSTLSVLFNYKNATNTAGQLLQDIGVYDQDSIYSSGASVVTAPMGSTHIPDTFTLTNLGNSSKIAISHTSTNSGYLYSLDIGADWYLDGVVLTRYYPSTYFSIPNRREFVVNNDYIKDGETAINFAQSIYNVLSQHNKTPIVQLVNRPSLQFFEIYDVVNLTVSNLGISSEDFRIGGIEHYGTPQELFTVYYLEPFLST